MTKPTLEASIEAHDRLLELDAMLEIGLFVSGEILEMPAEDPVRIKLTNRLERFFHTMRRNIEPAIDLMGELEDGLRAELKPN